MKTMLSIALSLFFLSAVNVKREFPEIKYTTNKGEAFTNESFMGKNTVVLLFHLGCPPAMGLIKDLESMNSQLGDSVQIIGIVENTPEQIKQFNSSEKNEWSDLRNSFQLAPIQIPLIGECGPVGIIGEEAMAGEAQCRMIAKKINTTSSPTLVFVDSDGNIVKVKKGYLSSENTIDKRIDYLVNP